MPSEAFEIESTREGAMLHEGDEITIYTEREDAAQVIWSWADGGSGSALYGSDASSQSGRWAWYWRLDQREVQMLVMGLKQVRREPFRFNLQRKEVAYLYELLSKLDY